MQALLLCKCSKWRKNMQYLGKTQSRSSIEGGMSGDFHGSSGTFAFIPEVLQNIQDSEKVERANVILLMMNMLCEVVVPVEIQQQWISCAHMHWKAISHRESGFTSNSSCSHELCMNRVKDYHVTTLVNWVLLIKFIYINFVSSSFLEKFSYKTTLDLFTCEM